MIHWIRSLLHRHDRRTSTPGQQAATHALARAENDKRAAEERQPQVSEAAARLRAARERNHFAELFRRAVEGGAP
ncbi:DUF7620 family protein [Streptomyces sp. NBC_00442]|uniref:DUF7620 family protein n=1 Tax=Streptomyces sp. NBC_00442 TaxID=2903651 RepID=UPI003FA7432F